MGLEQPSDSSENQGFSTQGGAESGAVDAQGAVWDAELAEVVARWPALPQEIRDEVLRLIRSSLTGLKT